MAAVATKAARKSNKATKSAKAAKGKASVKMIKTPSGKRIPTTAASTTNPYRVGSSYAAVVDSLRALGVGKLHDRAAVLKAYRTALGADGWKAFAAVKPRNKETGKDADGRAWQNVSVVGRKKDYGLPLVKLGWEVRFFGRDGKAGIFKVGSK